MAHIWRVRGGKAVRFQQLTDTLQAVRVMADAG
jgi:ketosteroid isomerase-like protein